MKDLNKRIKKQKAKGDKITKAKLQKQKIKELYQNKE
jgi:cystathionine beta-lyase/cystathionine gamma-synthase